jgi:hypothetical protein
MKSIILAVALTCFGASIFAAETKKVCVEQTDPKTKKVKEVCKDVKVHKKLEGTKVPDKQGK